MGLRLTSPILQVQLFGNIESRVQVMAASYSHFFKAKRLEQ